MAYKDPHDPRALAAKRRHYRANRAQYLERNAASKRALRALVDEAKSKPCVDCHRTFPTYVMDLHHRDPRTKIASVAELVSCGSRQKLLDEIDKCDVLCANCHRIRTHAPERWLCREVSKTSP